MKYIGCRQIVSRGRVWLLFALALFVALSVKLWCIQVRDHELYRRQADQRQGRCWPIRAPRGNIYDRNGNPLALNLKLFSVAADPGLIDDSSRLAQQLEPVLRMRSGQLVHRLAADEGVRYVRLRDSVDEPAAEALNDLGCPGLIVSTEWKRVYPHRELAAPLLGFIGRDMRALGGIESALDERLAGCDGEMLVVLDGRRPRSRSQIPNRSVVSKPMTPGSSVVLTLDLDIQAIAEEELAKAIAAWGAAGGTAAVMDPANGEVLALATQPSFDANEFWRYPKENWVSRAVVTPYEPGSTFKVITACAAIEEGVMCHGETYNCVGTRAIGGRRISCAPHGGHRAHGEVNLDEMVVQSCNTGVATVALALGAERMHAWARRFGFGKRTGIELGAESRGILPAAETWSQVRVANIGFGQGISVTALQLLSAYCAIANGGLLVRPRLVRAITDPTGETEYAERPAQNRILSRSTCERMREVLERVVEEGTGQEAHIPGRRIAGKTGTTQKPTRAQGFRSGKYIASFAGFAPAEDPRLAILVVIDEPQGAHYGGVVAAPAFRAICEKALTHLRVPPDAPVSRFDLARAGAGS